MHWGLGESLPWHPYFNKTRHVLFRSIPELLVCCCRHGIHTLAGQALSLSEWTKEAKKDYACLGVKGFHYPPRQRCGTTGLGSSTAHKSSSVHRTILQLKPNHNTVLFLSDHVMSQKLCGGPTKSPVISFTKFSQVIQKPECIFCQSEFAVIKLCSCRGLVFTDRY